MSRKISVSSKDADVEARFASWLKMLIDLIASKFLFIISGRATAKTSDILAERFIDCCYDMPGAYFAFVADTYVNAMKNVVPALIEGLGRKGWIDGIHYVVDQPPPAHFAKPYKPPQTYKHTISVFNGCFVNLVSMDQPSGAAGNSYQHIFGDEAKYLEFDKIKKLTPALRGYAEFSHSVYYRGQTFTTDMPNVADGEYDWILDREKDMDVEKIKLALQVGLVLNEIRKEMYHAMHMPENTALEKVKKAKEVKRVQRLLDRWVIRWNKIRKDSTFFYVASSFVNADVLSEGYFEDSLKSLGTEEFITAICSFKTTVEKGKKFYINLGEHHYIEGINTDYYLKYAIGEQFQDTCAALRYHNLNLPVDSGVDFGGMLSMVTGQELGNTVYLNKNFWTLPPESSLELAAQFCQYYKDHQNKILNMYYDRAGNQYEKVKKDWAGELAKCIEEYDDGTGRKWTVKLMNRNQATILHEEEYNLMRNIFGENNPKLPRVKICKFGCRELKSSMGMAKTKIGKNARTGTTMILKDKSSESIAFAKRPMQSTNMSDAAKYFFGRSAWMKLTGRRRSSTHSAPESVE